MKSGERILHQQTFEWARSVFASMKRGSHVQSLYWIQGFVAGAFFVTAANLWKTYSNLRASPNPSQANEFAIAWITAILAAILYVWIVTQIDRNENEPWRLLFLGFLWGAAISPILSGLFKDPIAEALQLPSYTIAPFTEEIAKGAILLLLLLFARDEFDNSLDGIVYGAMVGIGFALHENAGYFFKEENAATFHALFGTFNFYLRVVLKGLAGHATYTAITGLGLGLSRQARKKWQQIAFPIAGLAIAILAHSLWNNKTLKDLLLANIISYQPDLSARLRLVALVLIINGQFFLLIVAALFASWRKETQILASYLTPELDPASLYIAPGMLETVRSRFAARWRMLKLKGVWAWWQLAQLQSALIELAFCKWKGDDETALRDRIRALKQELKI
jgi:RsiW-degrading membrane proteinase PrsW (M82 family)